MSVLSVTSRFKRHHPTKTDQRAGGFRFGHYPAVTANDVSLGHHLELSRVHTRVLESYANEREGPRRTRAKIVACPSHDNRRRSTCVADAVRPELRPGQRRLCFWGT